MKTLMKWVIALVVVALLVLAWYRYQASYETWGYHVRYDFEAMPATDTALKEWLAVQPGVTSVKIERDMRSLRVDYESRNSPGTDAGIAVGLTTLGYRGPSKYSTWIDKPIRLRLFGG